MQMVPMLKRVARKYIVDMSRTALFTTTNVVPQTKAVVASAPSAFQGAGRGCCSTAISGALTAATGARVREEGRFGGGRFRGHPVGTTHSGCEPRRPFRQRRLTTLAIPWKAGHSRQWMRKERGSGCRDERPPNGRRATEERWGRVGHQAALLDHAT